MTIDPARIKSICEALIFVSEEAVSFRKIHAILEGVPAPELKQIIQDMMREWDERQSGLIIVEVAEGYQFRTRPENTEWVKMLVEFKPQRLSKPALETIAIIAYNQPATKPDIEGIRGVDCSSSLSQLLEKGLIKILGRKDGPGKPFIYGTTKKFLEVMGLKDLSSLPTLREIEESEIIHIEGLEDFEESDEPDDPDPSEGDEIDQLEQSVSDTEQNVEENELADPIDEQDIPTDDDEYDHDKVETDDDAPLEDDDEIEGDSDDEEENDDDDNGDDDDDDHDDDDDDDDNDDDRD